VNNTDRRPRALTIAFAAIFATAFFFAGYAVRTTRAAVAVVPIPTPTPFDGNPSGHHLWPQDTAMAGASAPSLTPPDTATLKKCLKQLASRHVEIFYVTAKPGQPPHLHKPTCQPGKICQTFVWKNMWTTSWKPSPDYSQNGTELVDLYGTLTVK
jgi:hypothetical protein